MSRKAKIRKAKTSKALALFDKLAENRVPGDPFTPHGTRWQKLQTEPDGTRRYKHTGNGRGLEVWTDPWDQSHNVLTGYWVSLQWHPDVLRQSVPGSLSGLNVDQVLAVMEQLAALERRDTLARPHATDFAGFPAVEQT